LLRTDRIFVVFRNREQQQLPALTSVCAIRYSECVSFKILVIGYTRAAEREHCSWSTC